MAAVAAGDDDRIIIHNSSVVLCDLEAAASLPKLSLALLDHTRGSRNLAALMHGYQYLYGCKYSSLVYCTDAMNSCTHRRFARELLLGAVDALPSKEAVAKPCASGSGKTRMHLFVVEMWPGCSQQTRAEAILGRRYHG